MGYCHAKILSPEEKKQCGCNHCVELAKFWEEDDSIVDESMTVLFCRECGHSSLTSVTSVKTFCSTYVSCTRKFKLNCGHWTKGLCGSDISSTVCPEQKIRKFSYCDHSVTLGCDFKDNLIFCKGRNLGNYPCGHPKPQDCYEDYGICSTICNEELPCGHPCPAVCHPGERHPICLRRTNCAKKCKRGHPCSAGMHLCSLPCTPCKAYIENDEDPCVKCGKMLKRFCKDDFAREICSNPCPYSCAQKHPCVLSCGEECVCKTIVKKQHPLCGHTNSVPCSTKLLLSTPCSKLVRPNNNPGCMHKLMVPCVEEDVTPQDVLKLCKMPCTQELACGHLCSGNCWDCKQGRLHLRCTSDCGRILLCGHVCTVPCNSDCPPCQSPCTRSCKHRKCDKKCGLPCKPCEEECVARCDCKDGFVCYRKCHEPCEKFCDKPCRRLIRCGHECIGFCGEICPRLCRVCDKEELETGIFTGDSLMDNHKFIQMDNCLHIIESQSMDGYIAHKAKEAEISPIGCPICRQPIMNLKRYAGVLETNREDRKRVYEEMYGSEEENRESFNELIALMSYDFKPNFSAFYYFLRQKLLFSEDMHKEIIKTYRAYYGLWRKSEDIYSDLAPALVSSYNLVKGNHSKDSKDLYDKCTEFLLFLTMCTVPLTKSEVEDLNREALRLNDFFEMLQRIRNDQSPATVALINKPSTRRAYARARTTLFHPERYSETVETDIRRLLRQLDLETNIIIHNEAKEKEDIVRALKHENKTGRWFKCPKGHPYIITECGGAMVTSVCNVCRSPIGGESHQILPGNNVIEELNSNEGLGRAGRALAPVDSFEPLPRTEPPTLILDI